jgi:putative peptidoglycan lipid II flippase
MTAVRVAGSLVGAAAGIAGVTVLARLAGLGRTAVFTHTVGYDCVAGTYQVANTVPNVVFEVVAGGALASVVVPVLAPLVQAGDREAASRTVSALLSWTVLLLVPVSLLGLLVAPTIVRLLFGDHPTCGPAALVVGADLLRVFAPQVVLYGVAVVLTGVLQAHHRFLGPALAPLLSSVVVGGTYLLYAGRGGATGDGPAELAGLSDAQRLFLGVGTTLGVVAMTVALVVPMRGTGLSLRPRLRFPGGVAPRVRQLAAAGVAVLAAQQFAFVVGLRLSSGGATTSQAVFTIGWTLFLVPWAVLAVPLATSAFPRLAAAEEAAFADLAARTLRLVVVVSLLGGVALFAAAGPIAVVLAQGPELAGALRAFAPGLLGYGVVALLTRALYARDRGRRAAVATAVGWAVVVAVDLLLVGGTDLSRPTALGLGNTAGMTVAGLLLAGELRQVAPGALAGTVRTTAVGASCAAAAAGLSLLVPDPGGVATALGLGAGLALAAAAVVVAGLRVADPGGFVGLRARPAP